MSDTTNIMAQVFMAGLFPSGLLCSSPSQKQAISAKSQVVGEEWFVPVIDNGIFEKYDRVIQTTAPTTDALRTVRLRDPDTGQTQWILGSQADWVDKSNACCGTTQSMPDVSIPDVMIEEIPCPVIDYTASPAVYNYKDVVTLPLATGTALLLAGSSSGVAFTPAAPANGFASIAAALAWAQANWGAYGTWSLTDGNNGIELDSQTVTRGGFQLTVKAAGSIATIGAITGGSAYTNGTYTNVPLTTNGPGTGATANITVASGAVSAVTLVNRGTGYAPGNTLSALAANIGGTGTGFSTTVATVQTGA